jgi:hypothetical protein
LNIPQKGYKIVAPSFPFEGGLMIHLKTRALALLMLAASLAAFTGSAKGW